MNIIYYSTFLALRNIFLPEINWSFQAFAIFCGLGIHNCQLYEGVCKLMAKQKVAIECLSYHAAAPQEETEKIKVNEEDGLSARKPPQI